MANYIFTPADHTVGTNLTALGWTRRFNTSNGDNWAIADVSGTKTLRFTQGANSLSNSGISWDEIDSDSGRADAELLAVFRANMAGSADPDKRLLARGSGGVGAENYAYCGVQTDTQLERHVGEVSAGTLTTITNTALSGSPDYRSEATWLAMRSRISGTSAFVKFWVPADSDDPEADEPESWWYSTDTLTVEGVGWVGLARRSWGPHEYKRLAFATNGDTATFAATPAGDPPLGTVTISSVTPGVTTASVAYSYDDTDQTGFEYRIDGGAAASIGASPATITGLTASTECDIEVRAINANGAGTWSAASTFTTDAAAPGNTTPTFDGPNIADQSGTESVAVTPLDVSGLFSDAESAMTFSAVGTWPAGVTVSSAGVISGTPTTAGVYSALQVRATDTGALTADSNTFSFTIEADATSITTSALRNNTGTVHVSASVHWTWLPAGRVGSLAAVVPQDGTGTTDAAGQLTVSGLTPPGILVVAKRNTGAADDEVYYEAFN